MVIHLSLIHISCRGKQIGNLFNKAAQCELAKLCGLDVPTRSFGGIGIFAINEMGRFYRHVLIQKRCV